MDQDADWTANALFSPSKARIAQAQARDWGFIETWLSKRYGGKRLPTFERNEDTLQALLTLATLNEGAEEQRLVLEKVHHAALQSYMKQMADEENERVYQAIFQHLPAEGDESLDATANIMVALDTPGTATNAELGIAATELQERQFEVALQQQRANDQQITLHREGIRVKSLLKDITEQSFSAPETLAGQINEWMKGSKHMKAKIIEYDERLAALKSMAGFSPNVEEITQQQESSEAQRNRLLGLDAELQAYQSLPTDAKAARSELELARDELRNLTQKRDRLFEKLVQPT